MNIRTDILRRAIPVLSLVVAGSASAQEAPEPTALATPLTLEQVLEIARERNPRLQAAHAKALAEGARESWASLPPDPALQIGVMNFSLPGFRADMPNSMAPAIQLTQMLPFPGKLGLSGRIAEQSATIADLEASETWWAVRSDVAARFFELYRTDRSLDAMRETLSLLRDFEQVAKAMYTAGQGRQSDVIRANVEVARMDAEIRRMEAMRRVASARLNSLLDRRADLPVGSPVLGPLPLDVPPVDTLSAWSETHRPLLRGGLLGVARADTREELARKEIWPDLMLGVQYGQRSAGEGTDRMASLMLGFSLPVFASRRQVRMRDEAAAMSQMAQADLAGLRASVDARISELVADIDRDRSLLRLYRSEILPQADANVQSALSSYRVGTVDFMTLIDARMLVNSYEIELARLLANYGQSITELEAAVGVALPRTSATLEVDR